jgi:hypothetical protein
LTFTRFCSAAIESGVIAIAGAPFRRDQERSEVVYTSSRAWNNRGRA